MPKGAQRKRCKDCKRVALGDARKMQWCDCGGEMIPIRYGNQAKARRGKR